MGDNRRAIFHFGTFSLDNAERSLLRQGQAVPLTPKAFDLLVVLVRNAGKLVSKDELLREVWPDSFVEEVNLSVNISALRKALGDDQELTKLIETVPKRGYRFIQPVTTVWEETYEIALTGSVPGRISDIKTPDEGDQLTDSVHGRPDVLAHAPLEATNPSRLSRFLKQRTARILLLACILSVVSLFIWQTRSKTVSIVRDSVAVLPFATDDPANNYLADGLTESTMNSLSRLTRLRVAPRTSVFRYKTQPVDVVEAGKELGVAAVVNGIVGVQNDTVNIEINVIDVARNSRLWTSRYSAKSSELIALETRISQDVLRALSQSLTSDEQHLVTKHVTENPDAYRAYLQGRYFWNQRSEEGLKKGVEAFQRATEIDHDFALAYSGLADSYTTLGYFSYISPTQAFPVAKNYALRALELDPALAEPHASLAYDKFYFDWDWSGAETEFKRAIALNPGYATAHQWYSIYLLSAGRPNEAFQEIYLARQYDPLSLSINTDIGFHYHYNRQYDEALKQLTTVLAMKKDFPLAHLWLGRSYQQLGRYDEALAEFHQIQDAFHGWPVSIAALGFVNAISNHKLEAEKALRELENLSKQKYVSAYAVALVYAGLGDKDQAFQWLNKAFDERSHWLVWLKLDPGWDGLRGDSRFDDLVKRMHFAGA
jgi:DNA-binding winged helix-turn-helix (wHTH) protein/TolB-like protein